MLNNIYLPNIQQISALLLLQALHEHQRNVDFILSSSPLSVLPLTSRKITETQS